MSLTEEVWRALGGAPEALGRVTPIGARDALPSPLAVEELLEASAGAALAAAAELAVARGLPAPHATLDRAHLAVAAASERHVRLDGAEVGVAFDPLSAFFPAADGWVRTHGNYPWHRAALLRAVGASTPEDVPAAIAAMDALAVEEAVVAAGGCAVAVRSAAAWTATPQGAATPLVRTEDGPATDAPLAPAPPGALPAAGLRVVDLTRVIAGPVGTRMLAALGADVTRVDDPARPELPLLVLDGGLGKSRVALDLAAADGRAALEALLADADAVVLGHRPGALDRFGLHPDALAGRHPQAVVVSLSAWGTDGPWGGRRGFDSLVQAASGIADALRTPDGRPGALPVQALDHATGYLVAAATLRALTRRARDGVAPRARLALAATAHALLAAGPRAAPTTDAAPPDARPYLVTLDRADGALTVVAPPGALDGVPLHWPRPTA